jgi:uncharacterized protein (TIGR03435 family)
MKRSLIWVSFVSGLALAQTVESPVSFDAADVHVSPAGTKESGLYLHAGRVELHGITMLHLITMAYDVANDKVFAGPNWLDSDRFEIVAKGSGVTHESYKPMLKALLAERFHLAVHSEDKPEPVFALVPGKRVLLKESGGGDPDCKRTNQDGYLTLVCHNMTMAGLAERLSGAAPNYFNHPVIDKTGLKGVYDVTLKWSGRGQLGGGDTDHPAISLFEYFDKELGIRVEQQTRPSASLVIDHVDEKPTANAPDIAAKLPPVATEFEVAEVHASKPGTAPDFKMQNGRLELMGLTLKDLITAAYDIDDSVVVGGEKWLDSDHFDVIAKAAPNTTDDTLRAMLLTLLIERFHLTTHEEQQPVTVYALTAPKGKGKLKEADGKGQTGCTRAPHDGAFTYSCRNTTMAQLMEKLPEVPGAIGYFNHAAVDLTGLKGGFDFDITWSPPGRVFGRGATAAPSAAAGSAPSAADPNGGLTIFEAVEKQLGLRLATQKYPMTVRVVDHADRVAM